MKAAPSYEPTVAAALRPILRDCVNAVRGPGLMPGLVAAKVGNAILPQELRTAAQMGRGERAEQRQPSATQTYDTAHRGTTK